LDFPEEIMQINANGISLNVERSGKGHPLIFIHGIGANLNFWENIIPSFSSDHEVIRYDLRGAGLSGFSPEPPLSVELWSRDLGSLMDVLRIKRADLVGWSLGGMIGLQFALNSPERVSSLILVGSTPKLQPAAIRLFEERAKLAENGGMEELVKNTFHTTEESFAPMIREKHPEKLQYFRKMLESYQKENYAAISRALIKADLSDKLEGIKTPALIVVGQYDVRTPLSDSELMCMKLSNSYMKILPDCGHFYGLEQPELFSRVLNNFLVTIKR
jgi:3-oxoadipate enol-lactonase